MSSEAPLLSDSVGGEHAIQTERINMDINRFILNFAQSLVYDPFTGFLFRTYSRYVKVRDSQGFVDI
jgi:hypothetical protein